MSKKQSKKTKYILVIALISILILALIGGAVCFAYWKTDGFKIVGVEPSKFIMINGKDISNDTVLPNENNLRIDVATTGFSVKVERKDNENFDFKIDGELAAFSDINDFTAVFNIKIYDKYLTINTAMKSMKDILNSLYPHSEVTNIPNDIQRSDWLVLKIVSADGKKKVTLKLDNIGKSYLPIELDTPSIIF